MPTRNIHFVDDPGAGTPVEDVYADNLPEGGGGEPYVLPAATTSTLGGVKMAANVADVSAANATTTASSATVDPTEFAAVVTLANECKAKLNALLGALETAGVSSAS